MNKYIKQLTPLFYALLVILVSSLLGVFWFKVKQEYGTSSTQAQPTANGEIPRDVKKITNTDPVRGNSKAKYALIEYSDYDCPFCKDFHSTVKDLVANNNDYKWIFRQFPLAQLHPKATDKAKAGVCVHKVAGNDAFWKFSDKLYENQEIEVAELKNIVKDLGVNSDKYTKCVDKFDMDAFNKTFNLARSMNVTGTPTTVIVNTENGKAVLAVGSLSKDDIISKSKELN